MNLRKTERGFAHLGLIVVVVVAIVAAAGAFVYTKQGNPSQDDLKADAAGAYSSICGSGFNLRHKQYGKGFTLYNYKRSDGKGCALVVNSNWGTSSKLAVKAGRSYYSAGKGGFRVYSQDSGTYRYYAGPIYYAHQKGVTLIGTKNGSNANWTITKN